MQWIDLPLENRPQLLMGGYICSIKGNSSNLNAIKAYEPSLDQAGHSTGPNSKLVNVCNKHVSPEAISFNNTLLGNIEIR